MQFAIPNVFKGLTLATSKAVPEIRSFNSFADFKKAMGPAGKGYAWHHIMEQNLANLVKFSSRVLHNTKNYCEGASGKESVHAKVSEYYN